MSTVAAAPPLRLTALRVRLGGRIVLAAVDLSVDPGEVLVLMGPSGAGKTTLIRVAAGLVQPESGRRESGVARVGVVFQEPRLLPWRSARDNILFALGRRPRAADRARADELLARLDLGEASAMLPGRLSGGMRQRVAIGRALIANPELVLLDEPLSALDVVHRQRLARRVVAELADRRAGAVWATHDPAEAALVADRILLLPADAERAPPRVVRPPIPRGLRTAADRALLVAHLTRLTEGGSPDGDLDTRSAPPLRPPPRDRAGDRRAGRRRRD